jgi:hypothetical protein
VQSPEFQDHTRQQRERFYALVPAALDALRHALEQRKDARMAYQVLADTGVIPSVEERTSALSKRPRTISYEARETLLPSLSDHDKAAFRVLQMFQKKAEVYGMDPASRAQWEGRFGSLVTCMSLWLKQLWFFPETSRAKPTSSEGFSGNLPSWQSAGSTDFDKMNLSRETTVPKLAFRLCRAQVRLLR